jgi:hypothetical protein
MAGGCQERGEHWGATMRLLAVLCHSVGVRLALGPGLHPVRGWNLRLCCVCLIDAAADGLIDCAVLRVCSLWPAGWGEHGPRQQACAHPAAARAPARELAGGGRGSGGAAAPAAAAGAGEWRGAREGAAAAEAAGGLWRCAAVLSRAGFDAGGGKRGSWQQVEGGNARIHGGIHRETTCRGLKANATSATAAPSTVIYLNPTVAP